MSVRVGDKVVAMYDYNPTSKDELLCRKGDILHIVREVTDAEWYCCGKADGSKGMIPANYVQKDSMSNSMPWLFGRISREQAERLLYPPLDGLFLVRESTSYTGDYTLCVSCSNQVEHYHIKSINGLLTIDDEEFFENLRQLVEHYTNDADGLCSQLLQPVFKDPVPPAPKSTTATHAVQNINIPESWLIKESDLILGESIGKGEFADVYKGEWCGKPVAIKQLKDQTTSNQFVAEAKVMTKLDHKNLVKLMGVVSGDQISIVTEYMAKGSLVEYLRTRGRTVITKTDQIKFAIDTCCGMGYLEKHNIIHRDLAARNVLIHEDGTAKVSDFGLARLEHAKQPSLGKFPVKWTAPEALKHSQFTSKSDMWSFGILLWEIYAFGRVPYPRIPLADVLQHVDRGYRMEMPDGCPQKVYEIMQHAWNQNPSHRPSFKEVSKQLNSLSGTL